jgi:hypothetical protein
VLKTILFVAVLVSVGLVLGRRIASVSWAELRFGTGYLVLAGLCQGVSMVLGPTQFRALLRRMGYKTGWRNMFAVISVTRLGKYLPGKLGSTVGAVWLLRERGIPVAATTTAAALSTALMMGAVLILCAPLALWEPVRRHVPSGVALASLLLAAGCVGIHPRVFFPAVNAVFKRIGVAPFPVRWMLRDYAGSLCLLLAAQAVSGVGLWFILRAVSDVSPAFMPFCVGGLALAGGIGMMALFVPAGLGVREGILLMILQQAVAPPLAAVAVVLSRLVQILMEAAMALIGLGLLHYRRTDKAQAFVDTLE